MRIGIPCPRFVAERALARYAYCLERAGGSAWLIRPEDGLDVSEIIESLDGLYLVGGSRPWRYPGQNGLGRGLVVDREREFLEVALSRLALERDLPVLGICRGMQVLNWVAGGRLRFGIPAHRAVGGQSVFHPIVIHQDSRLADIVDLRGDVVVNSRHRNGVYASDKAPLLEASAYCPDDGIIEALESPTHRFVVGVQCHPNRWNEVPPQFQRLFDAFVAACC